jgi:hypothetical protein
LESHKLRFLAFNPSELLDNIMTLFKLIRIVFLLLILVGVAFYTKSQKVKSQSWAMPLEIVIYPMNPERSAVVADYIKGLNDETFSEVDEFFQRESANYHIVTAQPTHIRLGNTVTELPPPAPRPDEGVLSIVWWGLQFRYWAFAHTPDEDSNHHRVRMFVYYYEVQNNRILQHSLGLNKGLLAIVHAFADQHQAAQNNIIIAHEFLHTVGAMDKYGVNNLPSFPDGFAEPDKEPLYPQDKAEIMSARIALSSSEAQMAESLDQCVVGAKTAVEINWQKN